MNTEVFVFPVSTGCMSAVKHPVEMIISDFKD